MYFQFQHRLLSKLLCFLAAVLFLVSAPKVCPQAAAQEKPVTLYFFHTVMCESCDSDSELLQILREELNPEEAYRPYELKSFCVYSTEGRQELDRLSAEGLYDGSKQWPAVLVEETWLEGYDAIRQGIGELLQTNLHSASSQAGEEPAPSKQDKTEETLSQGFSRFSDNTVNLLYFETEACSSCHRAGEALDALPSTVTLSGVSYPVVVIRCSIMEDENANLLSALFEQYDVKPQDQVVPILFLGDRYLAGADAIVSGSQDALLAGAGLGASYTAKSDAEPFIQTLAWGTIFVTGLLNGLNPCMLSMTLFFLSLLLTLPTAVKRCAAAFLAGKYFSYLLLGYLIYRAASELLYDSVDMVSQIMAIFLLVFSVVLAILNLMDFLHARKGEYGKIHVQLPEALRKWNHALMTRLIGPGKRSLAVPVVFAASALVSAGELLCSGQIYLASILQWTQTSDQSGVPILVFLLYVTALCIPSAILILLCVRGKSLFRLSQASLRQMTWTKLANTLLFLFMACLAAGMVF